jgi:hypothetical protein
MRSSRLLLSVFPYCGLDRRAYGAGAVEATSTSGRLARPKLKLGYSRGVPCVRRRFFGSQIGPLCVGPRFSGGSTTDGGPSFKQLLRKQRAVHRITSDHHLSF